MTEQFIWTDFYIIKFATKLLENINDREILLKMVQNIFSNIGMKMPRLVLKGVVSKDVNPFTVFGMFNKDLTDANRTRILSGMVNKFEIEAVIPEKFAGIPVINNMINYL